MDALTGSLEFDFEELVKRAVLNARPQNVNGTTAKWFAVSLTFAVGSTRARELCNWAGVDPDREILGPFCDCEIE